MRTTINIPLTGSGAWIRLGDHLPTGEFRQATLSADTTINWNMSGPLASTMQLQPGTIVQTGDPTQLVNFHVHDNLASGTLAVIFA